MAGIATMEGANMTGAEVLAIREALGAALGRRISQRDLARMLGLADANGKDAVRAWEDGKKSVSGPAAVALQLLGYGAGIGELDTGWLPRAEKEFHGEKIFRAIMLGIAESMLRQSSDSSNEP
jgi:DNA-binding transcriptional regulator YiaG